jgi:hypothetical protein
MDGEIGVSKMNLTPIPNGKLPVNYQAAKTALAECARIGECKDWADRSEALASHARQSHDESPCKMADRIQARAVRRCAELLKQIPQGHGARDRKRRDGTDPPLTRTQAATAAGLSERQRKTAIRIASVPVEAFESQVESDDLDDRPGGCDHDLDGSDQPLNWNRHLDPNLGRVVSGDVEAFMTYSIR